MAIENIKLSHFRLFAESSFEVKPGFNVIHGHNGTGKSSILEAIFYMARGRSFRTANSNRMIHDDANHFLIHLQIDHPVLNPFVLALQRDKQGKIKTKAGGEEQAGILALSSYLPTLFLDTDSHRLLASGPKHRRQLLDWGLFYGNEQQFYPLWTQYKRVLGQRNAALKIGQVDTYWDQLLVELGEQLSAMRQAYVERLTTTLLPIWEACMGEQQCGAISLKYHPGWAQNTSMAEALCQHRQRDQELGYTQAGPHRADLKININDKPAHHYLSQGQQKMLTYVLALACGACFHQDTQQRCIYLLDDFCAELDQHRREYIIQAIAQQQSQVLLTGIMEHDIEEVMLGRAFHRLKLNPRHP